MYFNEPNCESKCTGAISAQFHFLTPKNVRHVLQMRGPRGHFRSPEHNKDFRIKLDFLRKSDTMIASPIGPKNTNLEEDD